MSCEDLEHESAHSAKGTQLKKTIQYPSLRFQTMTIFSNDMLWSVNSKKFTKVNCLVNEKFQNLLKIRIAESGLSVWLSICKNDLRCRRDMTDFYAICDAFPSVKDSPIVNIGLCICPYVNISELEKRYQPCNLLFSVFKWCHKKYELPQDLPIFLGASRKLPENSKVFSRVSCEAMNV